MNGTNIRIFSKQKIPKSNPSSQKQIVIPHRDAVSAESWQDVKEDLQFKMLLKAKQIPRRGAV